MNINDVIKFPIYKKNGTIRCYTLIEARDLKRVSTHTWSLMGRNYIKARIDGKDIYLHRFIMNQTDPNIIVDHINRDSLDNRRSNLRLANRNQNAFNRKKSLNKSSQYKGVSFDKTKSMWQSYVKMEGIKYLLGYFPKEKQAAKVYDQAASYYYGQFASLNFSK